MKNYIFITMTIAGIGGAEQYILNKASYLEKIGYRVLIFSSMNRNIMIEGLKKYEKYIIPALMYSPSLFSQREINKTCCLIEKEYEKEKDDDGCVIESTSIAAAKWGELIAARLHANHIIFNLQEVHNYSFSEFAFLRFKNKRNELAGITDASFPLMLGEVDASYDGKMVFNAICSNVVQDCESPDNLQLFPADLTIGSIGRLDKDYVRKISVELRDYFVKNASSKFNMVFIGGAENKSILQELHEIFDSEKNVSLYITGNIYPIPRELLKRINVFISTSGSANVTFYEGIPTIKVHPITGQPAGIMGYSYDIYKSSMYEPLEGATIENQLDLIIKDNIKIEYDLSYNSRVQNEIDKEFSRQVAIVGECRVKEYYDTSRIPANYSKGKKLMYSVLGRIFGGNQMQKILERLRKAIK